MNNEKILYIPENYLKGEVKNYIYVKDTYENEILGKIWRNYDFEKAEEKIFELQCSLTKATFKKNEEQIRKIQDKITHCSEGKMLAIRKVTEISKSKAGIDNVVWRKDSEKMRAAITLNNGEYKAKPLKQVFFIDEKASKERQVGIPCMYDRAMQVLYSYALEPVAEAMADRKSFAFRKRKIA